MVPHLHSEPTTFMDDKFGEEDENIKLERTTPDSNVEPEPHTNLRSFLVIIGVLLAADLQTNTLFSHYVASGTGNGTYGGDITSINCDKEEEHSIGLKEVHKDNLPILFYLSLSRTFIITGYIIAIFSHKIRYSHTRTIRYSVLIISYLFVCSLIGIVLKDIEKDESINYSFYWTVLCSNVVFIVCQALLCYSIWTKKGTSANKQDPDDTGKSNATNSTYVIVKKLIIWYKPELFWIFLGQVLLAASATADSLSPFYEARTFDVISGGKALQFLYTPLGLHAFLTVASRVVASVRSIVTSQVSGRISVRVRTELFRNILRQDMGFFDKTRSGEITDRLTSFSDELSGVWSDMQTIVSSAVHLGTLLLVMVQMCWQLTVVLVTCNVFLLISTHLQIQIKKNLRRKVDKVRVGASNIGQEAITCIKTVRTFANEDEEAGKYAEKLQKKNQLTRDDDVVGPTIATINEILWISTRALTLIYGGHLVATGQMTSGQLVSFLVYMKRLFNQISRLVNFQVTRFITKFASVDRLLEYLERRPHVDLDGTEAPAQLQGKIEFKDVTFTYPSRDDKPVLQGVSFTAEPGEVVALVGPSGAGKSTCIQLMERFYDPDQGQILLDNIPVSEYQHKYLHNQIGLVSQEPTLFARSLRDNISYGTTQAVTESDIIQASRHANAHDFIMGLDDQYDTQAGEFGKQLSGGQKQRIAIARAVVRNPAILLLDEATSALDAQSEAIVQEALEYNMAGRTVIVVAHRLSTVARADKIVVLDSGRIVEQGAPQHLLAIRGLYYQLVKKQMLDYCVENDEESDTFSTTRDKINYNHKNKGELCKHGKDLYCGGRHTESHLNINDKVRDI